MDAAFFAVKRAHHAVLRFSRRVLGELGLTPARFDLLFTIADGRVARTQSALRKALGVARATISEMLSTLERVGLVARGRSLVDGRTRTVKLTTKGRELVQRASDAYLRSGHVTFVVDAVLADSNPERNGFVAREAFDGWCSRFRSAFGDFAIRDLFLWHPDEYLDGLIDVDPDDPTVVELTEVASRCFS